MLHHSSHASNDSSPRGEQAPSNATNMADQDDQHYKSKTTHHNKKEEVGQMQILTQDNKTATHQRLNYINHQRIHGYDYNSNTPNHRRDPHEPWTP